MNDSNSKFRKNPFPWLTIMIGFSALLACLCGWLGGMIAEGRAEEALKDDRLKAKLSVEVAAEIEAKKVIELKKLEQRKAQFSEERKKLLVQRSKDRATIDSLKKTKASAVKKGRPVAKEYSFKGSLVKEANTGRSIYDVENAKKDTWYNWFAEIHMVNENDELVSFRFNVGDLTIKNSEDYKITLKSSDVVSGDVLEYVKRNLQGRSDDRGYNFNGDINTKSQVILYIPFDEVNNYVRLVH